MNSPVATQLREQELMGNVNFIYLSFKLLTGNSLDFDSIAAEPWSNDTVMYQPYEVEQILLAENASCLAAKAFLNVNTSIALSPLRIMKLCCDFFRCAIWSIEWNRARMLNICRPVAT